jgi:phage tail sheath gpL-like
MSNISTAISPNAIAAIVGYNLRRLELAKTPTGLPFSIAILAEANSDFQTPVAEPFSFASADEVGQKMGYGSPAHSIARIVRPSSGGGAGLIDTFMIPQEEAAGASAATLVITVVGTATKSGTSFVRINGRTQIEGQNYSFSVEEGDTEIIIADKIATAIGGTTSAGIAGGVLASPVEADSSAADGSVTVTTKWAGDTASQLTADIEQGNEQGVTYSIGAVSGGTGVPDVDLSAIGEDKWYPVIINGLGNKTVIFQALVDWNGNADNDSGRYSASIWKPSVAYAGSTQSSTAYLLGVQASFASEMTNVLCTAPNSECFNFELAANWGLIAAQLGDFLPHRDLIGQRLTAIPPPPNNDIGEMAFEATREALVRGGVSTVKYSEANGYEILDSVTSYHPTSPAPQFYIYSRTRYFAIHFNLKYLIVLQYNTVVNGKTLTKISLPLEGTITLSAWKGVLTSIAFAARDRGLITNPEFTIANLQVIVPESNGNRVESKFLYKMTGSAVVGSISAQAAISSGEDLQ